MSKLRRIFIAIVATLCILFGVATSASAQTKINTWQDLAKYVGEQTVKMNAQHARITALEAQNALLKKTVNDQRAWIVDFTCKWNSHLDQITAATTLPPLQGPVIKGENCAGDGPAPKWPELIP